MHWSLDSQSDDGTRTSVDSVITPPPPPPTNQPTNQKNPSLPGTEPWFPYSPEPIAHSLSQLYIKYKDLKTDLPMIQWIWLHYEHVRGQDLSITQFTMAKTKEKNNILTSSLLLGNEIISQKHWKAEPPNCTQKVAQRSLDTWCSTVCL